MPRRRGREHEPERGASVHLAADGSARARRDREPLDPYRAFFEHSLDAALVTSPDGGIVEANDAACALFGYDRHELRTLGRAAVIDADDPRLARMIEERAATGRAVGRLTMRRKDGSRFEAELSSAVYEADDGALRTSMIVRDLTDRIAVERAARRRTSELTVRTDDLARRTADAESPIELCRALLRYATALTPTEALVVAHEHAGSAVSYAGWMNGEGIRETDPESASLIHDPSQVLATGPADPVHSTHDVASDPNATGPEPLRARSRSVLALPLRAPGGTLGVAEFRSSSPGAFRAQHVSTLRLATNICAIALHDLRAHQENLCARREAEAGWRHMREVVDQAPVMMATAEGPEHVFTGANHLYLERLGLRDIVGKRVIDVLPEIEAQGVIAILDRVYATGEPFVAEDMPMDLVVHGDTKRFWFNLVYQPIRDADGVVGGILANVNDVTPQHLAADELRAAYDQTIEGWAGALDLKDEESAGHSRRVTDLAVHLARRLGIEGEELEHLRRGALLHDIGKMGVRGAILLKPGALDEEEWREMKSHTTYAAELLEPIDYLRPARVVPLYHHERWDGHGYPHGLAGEAIPFAARIFSVVDVYDALTSDRPYRSAWSRDDALAHIRAEAGRQFDPQVVEAFLEAMVGEGA